MRLTEINGPASRSASDVEDALGRFGLGGETEGTVVVKNKEMVGYVYIKRQGRWSG